MITIRTTVLLTLLVASGLPRLAAAENLEPPIEESFTGPLSEEWPWQLGTWTAKDGVLRRFESGPRRHGPVLSCLLTFTGADIRFEFRLEGKATNAGCPISGTGGPGGRRSVRSSFAI